MTMLFRKTPKTFKVVRQLALRTALVEETDDKEDLDYNGISDFERFNGQGYEKEVHSGSPTQEDISVT